MKPKSQKKKNQPRSSEEPSPTRAKIVLFVFGIGPLLLMVWFLTSNGFFSNAG